MNNTTSETFLSQRTVKWMFVAVYVVLSVFVMGRFLISSNVGDTWKGATVKLMVSGEAERPYVYRRLVPELVGALESLFPEETRERVGGDLKEYLDEQGLVKFYVDQRPIFGYAIKDGPYVFTKIILTAVMFVFVWMFILSMQRLSYEVYGSYLASYLTPVIGLLTIPMVMGHIAFIYDLAGLGIAAMCYYFFYTKRYKWYVFGFLLACLNKETAIFITLIYALHGFFSMERKQYLIYLGGQLLLFVAVFATIYMVYLDNPQQPRGVSYMEVHLSYLLSNGYTFGFVSSLFVTWFMLSANWQQKPLFARWGIIQLMLMIVAYFTFGKAAEFRVFLDILPLPVLLITHTLCCLWPDRRVAK